MYGYQLFSGVFGEISAPRHIEQMVRKFIYNIFAPTLSRQTRRNYEQRNAHLDLQYCNLDVPLIEIGIIFVKQHKDFLIRLFLYICKCGRPHKFLFVFPFLFLNVVAH